MGAKLATLTYNYNRSEVIGNSELNHTMNSVVKYAN